jgi:hypothetical protein
MSQMNSATLKRNLEQKTKQELIQEIATLYNKFPAVKEYYQAQEGDINLVLEKYKDIIRKEFSIPTKGEPKARLSVGKKAIQDFKSVTQDPELLADIMLTFVESVSEFNNEFGPDVESFYTSPENLFEKTLELLKKHNLLPLFKDRAHQIVKNATDGWGHQDTLEEFFENFYGEQSGL